MEQDRANAKEWFAKAAKKGYADAMYNLATVLVQTDEKNSMPRMVGVSRAMMDWKASVPRPGRSIMHATSPIS